MQIAVIKCRDRLKDRTLVNRSDKIERLTDIEKCFSYPAIIWSVGLEEFTSVAQAVVSMLTFNLTQHVYLDAVMSVFFGFHASTAVVCFSVKIFFFISKPSFPFWIKIPPNIGPLILSIL